MPLAGSLASALSPKIHPRTVGTLLRLRKVKGRCKRESGFVLLEIRQLCAYRQRDLTPVKASPDFSFVVGWAVSNSFLVPTGSYRSKSLTLSAGSHLPSTETHGSPVAWFQNICLSWATVLVGHILFTFWTTLKTQWPAACCDNGNQFPVNGFWTAFCWNRDAFK